MAITKIQTGGIPALAVTHDKLHTTMDLSGKTVTLPSAITDTITNKLPLAGGTVTGNVTVNSTGTGDNGLFVGPTGYTGSFVYKSSGDAEIAPRSGKDLIFADSTGGTGLVRIKSNGNVGIGTTTPDALLHVQHTATNSPFIVANRYNDTSSGSEFRSIFAVSEADPYGTGTTATLIGNHNRHIHIGAFFDANGAASAVDSLTILSTGNVGIGTASPSFGAGGFGLELAGAAGAGRPTVRIKDTVTNNALQLSATATAAILESRSSGMSLVLGTSGIEKFRIDDSSGYLVSQHQSQVRLVLGSVGNSNTNSSNWIRGNASYLQYNSAASGHTWEIAGVERMRIDSSGRVTTPNQARVFAQGNINNWSNNTANQIYTAWQTTGADGSYSVGISFNASNGRFTVDVAGTYYIHASMYIRIGPSYPTTASRLNLRKNGGQWVNSHVHSNENIPDMSVNIEGLMPMAVNDYFTIDNSYAVSHYRGAVHTYLHAYLVG